MKFVEELGIRQKVLLEEEPDFIVLGFGRSESVALEDAAGVSVHDENGMIACIEENGVGGFRADAMDGEELLPQSFCGNAEHSRERTRKLLLDEAREGLQLFGFLAKVAGRADESGKTRRGDVQHCGDREEFLAAEIGDGALDVGPGSVLREDGADDDFEARAAGPPVLGAIGRHEGFII